jgi:mono/diheme cytochrome c family protein
MTNRRLTTTSRGVKLLGLAAAMMLAAGAVTTVAIASKHASPKLIGNAKAGKATFVSTCGVCHMLKAAKTVGTIGPNLNKVKPALTEAKIITAISKGGASIMTKAQLKKYPTRMVAYKGTLSTKVIDDVAAYVYTSTHM